MKLELINTIILAGSFLALFGFAELLFHFAKIKAEITRKIVHFGTGILTLLFPILLDNHWLVLFLCSSFALILFISLRFDLLKSINAIDRKSYGSLCYPLSVYICYLVYNWYHHTHNSSNDILVFYLPILILAISDPLAALFGKKWPIIKYRVGTGFKSILGSSVFFISSYLISFSILINLIGDGFSSIALSSLIIAFTTTVSEAFSTNGMDNLYIPLTGAFGTYICLTNLL